MVDSTNNTNVLLQQYSNNFQIFNFTGATWTQRLLLDAAGSLTITGGVTATTGTFGTYATIGNGNYAFHADVTNAAVRSPASNGGVYFQNLDGSTTYGIINGTGLSVNGAITAAQGGIFVGVDSVLPSNGFNISSPSAGGAIEIRGNGSTTNRGFRLGLKDNANVFAPIISYIQSTSANLQLLTNTDVTGGITATAVVTAPAFQATGYSTGAFGVVTTASTWAHSDGAAIGYGMSTNSGGGLDIMANQGGQAIRFYAGTANNASPPLIASISAGGFSASGNVSATGIVSGASASFTGNVSIGGNITVTGNADVTGAVTFHASDNLIVSDPMIYLGENNQADVGAMGMVASYNCATTEEHTGLVRDAGDKRWKLFSNIHTEPGANINFADSGTVYDTLKLGRILVGSGSAGAPGITFSADTGEDTGFYWISDGSIGISCNAVNVGQFNTACSWIWW